MTAQANKHGQTVGRAVVASTLAVLGAGCSTAVETSANSGAGTAAPTAAAAATAATTAAPTAAAAVTSDGCPSPRASAAEWPLAVPADLPKPPGAVISSSTVQGKTTVVRFTTDTSLEGSVRFLTSSLPRSGYTLARGDAEATEADAPFSGPRLTGAWKMSATGDCSTSWLLAVQPRSANPATPSTPPLIPHPPGVSAAPLSG